MRKSSYRPRAQQSLVTGSPIIPGAIAWHRAASANSAWTRLGSDFEKKRIGQHDQIPALNAGPPPPNHRSTYFEKPFGSFQIAVFGYPNRKLFFSQFSGFCFGKFQWLTLTNAIRSNGATP
jgi:hypothetical protein